MNSDSIIVEFSCDCDIEPTTGERYKGCHHLDSNLTSTSQKRSSSRRHFAAGKITHDHDTYAKLNTVYSRL